MTRFLPALALLVALLPACAKETVVSHEPRIIDVKVLSGRSQPPADRQAVRLRQAVVVRAEGLGPPRLTVVAPDGSPLGVSTTPVVRDGHVTGSEVRFTPAAKGEYRVEDADAPGTTLALLTAS